MSDGGLLVALAEMAMASGIGAGLAGAPAGVAPHAFWFGEDQARYVVTVDPSRRDEVLQAFNNAHIEILSLGTTGGDALTLPGERPILLQVLRERFEGWLPAYMAAGGALNLYWNEVWLWPWTQRTSNG